MRVCDLFRGVSWDSVRWRLLGGAGKRRLKEPARAPGTPKSQLVNLLLHFFESPAYLEIGLDFGRTFEAVTAPHRVGVDPRPRFDLRNLPPGTRVSAESSDTFFRIEPPGSLFDVVLVDGLHEAQQALRDVSNSLTRLRKGGFVVIDDVFPHDRYAALPDQRLAYQERVAQTGRRDRRWQGDVYRLLPLLVGSGSDIDLRIFDVGGERVAVIRKAYEHSFLPPSLQSGLGEHFRGFDDFSEWWPHQADLETRDVSSVQEVF